MIYVMFNEDTQVTGITSEHDEAVKAPFFQNRNDWKTEEEVIAIAAEVTKFTSDLYLPVNNGPHVRPQFDIFKAPKIGDEVSMGFNGDYYPCGKISSISKTMKKIVTDNGTTFYRRSTTRWLNCGTFAMIPGVHEARNPHF